MSPTTIYRASRGDASCVVAGVRVAYSLPMVSVAQDEAQHRKASIEAACRIALRMAGSGRGSEASLVFLLGVTARELNRVATIVGEGEEREAHCGSDAVPPAPYWATPIRARSGKLLGELRVVAAASGGLDDADLKALTTVARTAARIMARTDD